MNKVISWFLMISIITAWLILSCVAPWVLSDNNELLRDFIGQGSFLSFLGVVVSVTAASAVNLHLELNKIEEKIQKKIFNKTRKEIKQAVYWLIISFQIAVILIILKSLIPGSQMGQSLINGACLLIVFSNILALLDLTKCAFAIPPDIK